MRTNNYMEQLLKECSPKRSPLTSALRAILDQGFAYVNGCVLLKSQLRLTQSDVRDQFQDETGYECFVNHVHLEDILGSTNVCFLLEQALNFADQLSILKSNAEVPGVFEYIVISDENEVNVRFHIFRSGQSWLASNLEAYEEAVAAIRLPNDLNDGVNL